jgi:hypothetical protein
MNRSKKMHCTASIRQDLRRTESSYSGHIEISECLPATVCRLPVYCAKTYRLKGTELQRFMFLCKCETWCATGRGRCRLEDFENVALRKKHGPKKEAATGDERKFYSEELRDKWSLPC